MNLVSNLDYTPASGEHVLKTYSDVSANTVSSGGQFAYTPDYHDIPAIGTGTTYVYPKGMFVGGSTIISTQQFGHTCINATQVWPPIIAMKLDTIAYVNNEILINCDVPYFITEPTYARQGAFRITYAFTSGTKPNCTYQMYDSYVTKSFPSSNLSEPPLEKLQSKRLLKLIKTGKFKEFTCLSLHHKKYTILLKSF